MFNFGNRSEAILDTLHPDLQRVAYEALMITPYDFSLISGHRGEEEQNELFRKGLSKLQYPLSKHNSDPAEAFDFIPYPVDWKDERMFSVLAGVFFAAARQWGIKIRWGGDWDGDGSTRDQTFMDLGHIELDQTRLD